MANAEEMELSEGIRSAGVGSQAAALSGMVREGPHGIGDI